MLCDMMWIRILNSPKYDKNISICVWKLIIIIIKFEFNFPECEVFYESRLRVLQSWVNPYYVFFPPWSYSTKASTMAVQTYPAFMSDLCAEGVYKENTRQWPVGAWFNITSSLPGIGIPILKIIRSLEPLAHTMGIPYYCQTSSISCTKSQYLNVSRLSCSCLCPIHCSQVLSRVWICSLSSADSRCSNYIWVINNFIVC